MKYSKSTASILCNLLLDARKQRSEWTIRVNKKNWKCNEERIIAFFTFWRLQRRQTHFFLSCPFIRQLFNTNRLFLFLFSCFFTLFFSFRSPCHFVAMRFSMMRTRDVIGSSSFNTNFTEITEARRRWQWSERERKKCNKRITMKLWKTLESLSVCFLLLYLHSFDHTLTKFGSMTSHDTTAKPNFRLLKSMERDDIKMAQDEKNMSPRRRRCRIDD